MHKEPWSLSGTGHVLANGKVVCDGTNEADARRIVACVNACAGISTETLEACATDKTHGCHVDLEDGMDADGCVLDEDRPEDCVYAQKLLRDGRTKLQCEYWKPITLSARLRKVAA